MMRQFEVVPPPVFTDLRRLGSDIQLKFTPTPNRFHFVERKDNLVSGSWTNFTNNILGIGTNVSVIDAGAATRSNRFYRLGLSP
jgi:hypothetical protein